MGLKIRVLFIFFSLLICKNSENAVVIWDRRAGQGGGRRPPRAGAAEIKQARHSLAQLRRQRGEPHTGLDDVDVDEMALNRGRIVAVAKNREVIADTADQAMPTS